MTYGKYIVSEVKMNSRVWGAVMYTNVLGIIPEWFLGFVIFDEGAKWAQHPVATWTGSAWGALLLSCILGTAIAYAGFNCRNVLSATSFTVVGVLNKMLTTCRGYIAREDAKFRRLAALITRDKEQGKWRGQFERLTPVAGSPAHR